MATKPIRKRVIIIGAGFGGLWAARNLAGADVDITIISRENYHVFYPLLYQVAAAELEPGEIIHPVRSIIRGYKNADFLLDNVVKVDLEKKIVKTTRHELEYDYLVLAPGSRAHYLNIEGADKFAFALKNLEDAIRLRNHILMNFEKASREKDAGKRKALLSFAIVGGGATGVEFAGALAELIKKPLMRDFPGMDFSDARIDLFEVESNLMAGFSKKLQDYTLERLRRMGVNVHLQKRVVKVERNAIHIQGEVSLPTETVIWTAGVHGAPPPAHPELPILHNQQVEVLPTLQVRDHPEVYVAGDLARVIQDNHPLTMIATVAIQEGAFAAKNIKRHLSGREPKPFVYHDPGTMATIGRNAAICHILGVDLTGFAAWVFWLGVHIVKLIGFRNRLLVLINWLWDYLFYERAARLILSGWGEELRSFKDSADELSQAG